MNCFLFLSRSFFVLGLEGSTGAVEGPASALEAVGAAGESESDEELEEEEDSRGGRKAV
jgi:hypothetical protein